MLKPKLKSGGRTHFVRKHETKVFDRVQQWVSLTAGRWRLFAAKACPPAVELPVQFAPQPINRFQRKGQPELFGGSLDGKPGQQFHQPGPHARRGEGVPW